MGFGAIPNRILNDQEISAKAKGLWVYLESKPDGWDFAKNRIARDHDDGRASIMTGLQELEERGYLERKRGHGDGGQFRYEYHLSASPMGDFTPSDNPTLAEPTLDNRTPKKERVSKKDKNTKSNSKNTMTDEHFDEFWEQYPRKVGKQKCKNKFLRLSVDKFDKIMSALEEQKDTDQWKRNDGQFVPHPTTWINQGRWEDDPEAYNYEEDDKETGVAVKSY